MWRGRVYSSWGQPGLACRHGDQRILVRTRVEPIQLAMRRTGGTFVGAVATIIFALLLLDAVGVEVLPFL